MCNVASHLDRGRCLDRRVIRRFRWAGFFLAGVLLAQDGTAQNCTPSVTTSGRGAVRADTTADEFFVEVNSQSRVVLENRHIRVEYAPIRNKRQFLIRKFVIKAFDEDQIVHRDKFMEADSQRGPLKEARVIYDGVERKTVRLEWYVWRINSQSVDFTKTIIHHVTIYPDGPFLQLDYVDIRAGLHLVDGGEPGGVISGEHIAFGGDTWIRPYILHNQGQGLYYSRDPAEGLDDPLDGGPLNYNDHFIFGVFNPANGRGFGRVLPVEHSDIVKLIFSETQRGGWEFFWDNKNDVVRSYLYAVLSGGGTEVLSTGQDLADSVFPAPEYPCGTSVSLSAEPAPGWTFAGWSGDATGMDNPLVISTTGDPSVHATFTRAGVDVFEDFESYLPGDDPVDFFDTGELTSLVEDDTLFSVQDVDGSLAFGTDSTLTNIHSHFVGTGAASLTNYEVTGRMRVSHENGGIGVTCFSQFPADTPYYRLRRLDIQPTFHLTSPGAALVGDLDTEVVPVAGRWYQFRLEAQDTGAETVVRAKVWADDDIEPFSWQASAVDSSAGRLTAGTVGTWSYFTGSKYWDDLAVVTVGPDTDPPVIRDIEVSAGGSSATITWETDELSTTALDYGVQPVIDQNSTDGTLALEHRVDLSGLVPGAYYAFTASSTDRFGNTATSETLVFRASGPFFTEGFDGFGIFEDPADWVDTGPVNGTQLDDTLFETRDVLGERVYATTSTLAGIHSHLRRCGQRGVPGL